MTHTRRAFPRRAAVLVGALLLSGYAAARPPALDLRAFLTTSMQLSDDQLDDMERGDAITTVLPSDEDRDVAVFGIITVNAPRDAVAAYLSALPASLSAPGRTAFGLLHSPALPRDLAALTRSPDDVDVLRDCHAGACAFKLANADMSRLHTILQQSTDTAEAARAERRRLASVANAYRLRGNDGLPTYDDYGTHTVTGASAFETLLSQSPDLFRFAPGLREYLHGYPKAALPGVRDAFYWARDENSGMKPTTTLNHRMVYAPAGVPGVTIVATKAIVADHYLEGMLEVIAVVDRVGPKGKGSYVMFLRRYRFDQMPSAFIFSLRGRVTGKLADRAQADLERIRDGATANVGGGGRVVPP